MPLITLKEISLYGRYHHPYDDDITRPSAEDAIESYYNVKKRCRKLFSILIPEKINPIPFGGCITYASVATFYSFNSALIINRLMPCGGDLMHVLQGWSRHPVQGAFIDKKFTIEEVLESAVDVFTLYSHSRYEHSEEKIEVPSLRTRDIAQFLCSDMMEIKD